MGGTTKKNVYYGKLKFGAVGGGWFIMKDKSSFPNAFFIAIFPKTNIDLKLIFAILTERKIRKTKR